MQPGQHDGAVWLCQACAAKQGVGAKLVKLAAKVVYIYPWQAEEDCWWCGHDADGATHDGTWLPVPETGTIKLCEACEAILDTGGELIKQEAAKAAN
jgi:hypothetical protein